MRPSAYWLLAGYLLARCVLGALLNPPLNGPDEGGHMEYVRTLIETGGRQITGVEYRQPPTYYVLAAGPWLATQSAGATTQLFFVRLLSALCGLLTLAAAWGASGVVWPGRPLRRVMAALVATVVPGFLFLLESASNDPLAIGLASIAVWLALRLWMSPKARRSDVAWFLAASLAAVATKLTALPVALALCMALLMQRRRVLLRPLWVRALGVLAAAGALAVYGVLLSRSPTTSLAASAARFWPLAVVRAPVVYVRLGGLTESFRTFWYAYDYAVRWPRIVEGALAGSVVLCLLAAVAGLARQRWEARTGRGEAGHVPWLLWAAGGAQVALVIGRFGLGDVLQIAMGGAGQAKAFFPAIVPLSVLFVAGLAAMARWMGLRDERWLTLGTFGWLLGLDAVSLALTAWHHYRWWQAGL